MPRKVCSRPDYDDDFYDRYDDYQFDNDHDYDADIGGEEARPSSVEKEDSKPHVWRCSVCTFDNDENLPYCELCGIIRDPSAKSGIKSLEKVDMISNNYGVSTMAQSIFSSVSSGSPKTSTFSHKLNGNHSKCDGPFKFDRPSPDDAVYARRKASKGMPKVSATTSTSTKRNKGTIEMSNTSSSPFFNTNKLTADVTSSLVTDSVNTEIVATNLQRLDLDKDFVNQHSVSLSKTKALPEYQPETWMLEKEKGALKQLNLAIIGHVDSGKSTMSGRLLYLLGRVTNKEMHKYEKQAKDEGKGSFAYAWVMDESAEERERGVTMTVALAYFDTKNYHVVLLDSPGHKDFVPNMIYGATQADAAIIVIDASIGAFEAGMDGNGVGQTREHAQLIRSFGVENIIVLVNKMDVVGYSKERFDFIKSRLGTFLRSCQFKEPCIAWVPASAMENQNLVKFSSEKRLSSWYNGPCLLEAIDSLQTPERDISKPLCMPICDVSHDSGKVSVTGKLESGAIRNGSKVLVMPSAEITIVRSIECNLHRCKVASAGDNVTVVLQDIDSDYVFSGSVLCHPDFPVVVGAHLELKINVLDITMPILVGSQVEFLSHHAKEAAGVAKICSVVNSKTKKVSKNKVPRFLTAKQTAVIEVVLNRPICIEEFSNRRALGRAFLRKSGNTIAVGKVIRVMD